jgi:chorismate synthase
MSSSWGERIRLSIFGQSHSAAIGAVVEGLPAGFPVDMEKLAAFMARRAPGNSPLATPRKEADAPEFLSGIANGRLCGAPLAFVIRNTNVRPGDYSEFTRVPRPGHADWTASVKYGGFQDASGGGHFSGRLTAPLTAAGGICMQILERLGVFIGAHIASIGAESDALFDPVNVCKADLDARVFSPLTALDAEAAERMAAVIETARAESDSVGGVVECAAVGLPAGVGEPMFDGLESRVASIVFGIPAVRGVEFGAGFAAARMRGSEHNDPFVNEEGRVRTSANNHGGVLGGISSGMPLIFRVAFKPTPSIGRAQRTLDLETMEQTELRIKGRHDPCVVVRAVPVVEAACAVALCDALLPGNYEPLKF